MAVVESAAPGVPRDMELHEYLKVVRAAIDQHRATPEIAQRRNGVTTLVDAVYRQCAPQGLQAQLSERAQRALVEAVAKSNGASSSRYADYWASSGNAYDGEKVEGPTGKFLDVLANRHPLLGITAHHLYAKADDAHERPYKGWYVESIETAARTSATIQAFFDRLLQRSEANDCDGILDEFLEVIRNQQLSVVKHCVNLANCFVMRSRKKDSGVLPVTAEFSIGNPSAYTAFLRSIAELRKFPAFANFPDEGSNVGDYGPRQQVFQIPTVISIDDLVDFLHYFEAYWQSFFDGLKADGPHTIAKTAKDGAVYFGLNRDSNIFIRQTPTPGKRPLISFLGNDRFDDFNMKVIKDVGTYVILDVGFFTPDVALAYARKVGQASLDGNVMTKYSSLIDEQAGTLKSLRQRPQGFYPSLMFSDAKNSNGSFIPKSSKAAMFAAVAMQQGRDMELSNGRTFSNHWQSRELGRFSQRFSDVALEFGRALL